MSELQFDNPSAPDYDWQKDREWFNQRLSRARIHSSLLEKRIARLRRTLNDIATGDLKKIEMKQEAHEALRVDDQAAGRSGKWSDRSGEFAVESTLDPATGTVINSLKNRRR